MKIAIIAAALCLTSMTTACISREHGVMDVSGAAFSSTVSTDRAAAIKSVLKARGWSVDLEKEGAIQSTYRKPNKDVPGGEHAVTIRIDYDATTYSIKYVDSANMMYNAEDGTIHRNYNRWINNLEQDLSAIQPEG